MADLYPSPPWPPSLAFPPAPAFAPYPPDLFPDYAQAPSSIGPDRVLTRRQRAALAQSQPPPRHQSPYPRLGALPLALAPAPAPPPYPAPPASPYTHFPFPHHARSASASTSAPRSASPALSAASAATSMTSASAASAPARAASAACAPAPAPAPFPTTYPLPPAAVPRPKHRKQRLFNVDRKAICVFHRDFPNARQEDIAARYGVERSTISKILKQKQKWLSVPEHEALRIAKHRPSKFPDIEMILVQWLIAVAPARPPVQLTDALLRAKAKETAARLGIEDARFKASAGWIENFKHRHGIRGGVWHGDGRNSQRARALGMGAPRTPAPPADGAPLRTMSALDDPLERAFREQMAVPVGPDGEPLARGDAGAGDGAGGSGSGSGADAAGAQDAHDGGYAARLHDGGYDAHRDAQDVRDGHDGGYDAHHDVHDGGYAAQDAPHDGGYAAPHAAPHAGLPDLPAPGARPRFALPPPPPAHLLPAPTPPPAHLLPAPGPAQPPQTQAQAHDGAGAFAQAHDGAGAFAPAAADAARALDTLLAFLDGGAGAGLADAGARHVLERLRRALGGR